MNGYEFLSSLGFWQWCGVLFLAGIIANGVAEVLGAMFRRKP